MVAADETACGVADGTGRVAEGTDFVVGATERVADGTRWVVAATGRVADATGWVAAATGLVVDTTGSVVRATESVAGATKRIAFPLFVRVGTRFQFDFTPCSPMADSRLSLVKLCHVIGEPVRWRMLAELVDGEPRTTTEFARLNRTSDSAASKHLNVLREFGIIETRHRVHYLAARYRPAPGTREIDFGGCVIRLSEPSWLKP